MKNNRVHSRDGANILLKLLVRVSDRPDLVDPTGLNLKRIQDEIYEKQKYMKNSSIRYNFHWSEKKKENIIENKFWKQIGELAARKHVNMKDGTHVSLTLHGTWMNWRIKVLDKDAMDWISAF